VTSGKLGLQEILYVGTLEKKRVRRRASGQLGQHPAASHAKVSKLSRAHHEKEAQ